MNTGTARLGIGSRPRAWLPILIVGLLSVLATPARSHPARPAPGPLPSIIYPSRDPDTATADPVPGVPSLARPQVPVVADSGEPVQYRYVNGVWGYVDRFRRFHPGVPRRAEAGPPDAARPRDAVPLPRQE